MRDREMEELYLQSLKSAGSRIEDVTRSMYCGFVLTDYTLYKQAEEAAGVDVARRVHKTARLKYIPWVIKDAFEDFRIGEVKDKDVATVGRIARRVYERTSCPFKIKEDTADRFVGIILKCPVVAVSMGLFDEKLGCPYHQSLAEVCRTSMTELVSQLRQNDYIETIQDQFICRGDDYCRVTIQRKS